jgi:antirestriction protein ArdC
MAGNSKIYKMVTDRILGMLDEGVIPWQAAWSGGGFPTNLISGKRYRGVNVFILAGAGYTSKNWLTYKQAVEAGGSVRKGEKGTQIIFWRFLEREEINRDTGETEVRNIPLLRYYTVFNLNQTEGIADPDENDSGEDDFEPIGKAEQIFNSIPNRPQVDWGKRPCYSPAPDVVGLPEQHRFISNERFYKTAFHELIHSTGHADRLNRSTIMDFNAFGSHEYSKEELIAEFGASFLCAEAGIVQPVIENAAAYIDGWSRVFQKDKKIIVCAAAAAQKAADYILGTM